MSERVVASAGTAPGETVLSLRGVGVRLGGRQVLDDVSFDLHAGEVIGLIGSNGAGKTTILRVILGLREPTAGSVDAGEGHRARRRRRIGYVPQQLQLDPDLPLRVRDLVALGVDGNRPGFAWPRARRRASVDAALEAVGLVALADARVGTLSGGEQQRMLIAHALVSEPEVLLLDEPLANLDLRSEQDVVGVLAAVAHEQQVAVLVSAHELNPLLPVLDRVVYLAAGHAAIGRVDEVVRTDVLSKLYGHHVDVLRVHDRIIVVAGPGAAPHAEDLDVVARRPPGDGRAPRAAGGG